MKTFVNVARLETGQLFTQGTRRGHPFTLDTFLVDSYLGNFMSLATVWDSNWAVQLQKLARVLKVWIWTLEVLNYPGSEEQRHWSHCTDAQADLHLCCSHMAKQVFSWRGSILKAQRGLFLRCKLLKKFLQGFVWPHVCLIRFDGPINTIKVMLSWWIPVQKNVTKSLEVL